jgi:EAL domain-containing protein (putative c-di-GMP-specific phosphodiesterase class I)
LAVVFLAAVAAVLVASAILLGSLLNDSTASQRLHGAELAARVFASVAHDKIELEDGRITPRAARRLGNAVRATPDLFAIRVWDRGHRLLYASLPALRSGAEATPTGDFRAATRGETASDFTSLEEETNSLHEGAENFDSGSEVEVYVPIHQRDDKPPLVLEAYLGYEQVRQDMTAATRSLYLTLGGGALLFYLALLPTLFQASRALAESRARRSPALQRRLRRAIRRNELVLHYQPKLDLRTRRVAGVEALVRWRLPGGRLAQPGEFLPHVEQTEVMKPLTLHLVELALRQAVVWERANLPLNIAVNLSSHNVTDRDLARELERLAGKHGVSPSQLTLEVTETAAMCDPDEGERTLVALAARGFQLSIDDFGTGQSSLARLDQLPVREIKIDRSIVKRMDLAGDTTLVRTIVGLAHQLGMRLVAEGVEADAIARHLEDLGCDVVQGFGIGLPVGPEELPDLVDKIERTMAHRLGPAEVRNQDRVPVGRG